MDEKQKKILEDTFREVMEVLAFMFVESIEKDKLPEGEEKYLHSFMSFTGPLTGQLEIIAGAGLCSLLAANMLGVESGDKESQEKSADALKETLNTICGRFLTALAGEKPVFSLTIPEISEIDNTIWDKLKNIDNTLFFRIDEYPVLMMADYRETL